MDPTLLHEALELLGDLLSERGLPIELVAVGGGALLLLDITKRPTADLDVVARRGGSRWYPSRPLPRDFAQAVEDVATALELPKDKSWLNDGPSFLFDMGLPTGWEGRTTVRTFGALTIRLLAREDILVLKLWAATDARAPGRRARDITDLRLLTPTREELVGAVRWCQQKDGTASFIESSCVLEILRELGFTIERDELNPSDD